MAVSRSDIYRYLMYCISYFRITVMTAPDRNNLEKVVFKGGSIGDWFLLKSVFID